MSITKCSLNLDRTRRELTSHGSPSFPCAAYLALRGATSDEIPWHWHEEIEVSFIADGMMQVQLPGVSYELHAGESIFINSGILHHTLSSPNSTIKTLVFHPLLISGSKDSSFAKKYISPLTECTTLSSCVFSNTKAWDSDMSHHLNAAFESMSTGNAGYEFVVREHLSAFCFSLYMQFQSLIETDHKETNTDNARVQDMLNFMHEHYTENITLKQIACNANIGERECLRCFKRVIQISPMQYLLKYRISQAAMLLQNNAQNVAEVSSLAGFDSPSYFSQMFKRFYNCSPRDYRKQISAQS